MNLPVVVVDRVGRMTGLFRAPMPEGKGEAGVSGLPLPVVAMGSIPHIYRREDFLHRATPVESAPFEEPRCALSHVETEALETQQAKILAKVHDPELVVVVTPLPLQLHAPHTHADP